MGIMILPLVSSLSEDALHSVPNGLREGAYALGATRMQAALRVVVPAAFSGISAAAILAVSRAIGETMIVAIAAGQQPRLTLDPRVPVETMTAYIVQVSLGDTPAGTLEYRTIFAVGMLLFLSTFALNLSRTGCGTASGRSTHDGRRLDAAACRTEARCGYLGDRLLASFGLLVTLLALAALGAAALRRHPRRRSDGCRGQFLTSYPSRRAEQAGILPALVGSIYVIGLTALIAVPLGVGAAIYLEEYGGRGRLSRLIEINIANLAGVPSIIYGLLGLGLFVRMMGMGQSVLAGGCTLALLALPVDHHLDARSAARGAQVAARGLLRARRDQVADDLASGAAGGVSRRS